MEISVKKLLSEVISESIEQYEQHRGVYIKDSEWTNDAIGKALMNTMEVKFKTLNLLYVSKRSKEQIMRDNAITTIELLKGYTPEQRDSSVIEMERLAGNILELTNDI